MPFAHTLRCPLCNGTQSAIAPAYEGCHDCLEGGHAVNMVCENLVDVDDARRSLLEPKFKSMWDFGSLLPVDEADRVDLGEGWTPLIHLPGAGREIGVPNLWAKNESANPTWSHKDRLSAVATAAARRLGAHVTTAVSTGNHGGSVAAYAARAGIRSVIFTLQSVPEAMKAFIGAYGSIVVAAPTVAERNLLMKRAVSEHGLFPISNFTTPPIGSSPFGVEGYKTIAFETWIQLGGDVPDWIVVPVGYGDCASGVARGFRDLVDLGLAPRIPRLVAAEVFGAVGAALAQSDPPRSGEPESTSAFSIATVTATDQSLRAVRDTDGLAVNVTEKDIVAAQRLLGGREGLFAEAASATTVAAIGRLAADGVVKPTDSVVALLTSTGLKDPVGAALWEDPVVGLTGDGDINAVLSALGRLD